MSAILLRRAGRRSLSLAGSLLTAQRSVACRASLPAAAETATSAVSQTSVVVSGSSSQPVPFSNVRGFATGSGLAGGAFVIRRVPQAAVPSLPASDGPSSSLSGARGASVAAAPQPPSPGRSLATSATPFCNLAAGGSYSDFEEAPFGHPAPFAASGLGAASVDFDAGESESEDDEVAVAQVGGSILFGKPRVSRTKMARQPVEQMEARWIGSASHSGDWSRASTVKPVGAEVGATIWAQIIAACREDPAQLKSTVAMLHAAFEQSKMVPPLPAFNKLLEVCSKRNDAMETVHQLVAMMSDSALQPNAETHKHLEACFAYHNLERSLIAGSADVPCSSGSGYALLSGGSSSRCSSSSSSAPAARQAARLAAAQARK